MKTASIIIPVYNEEKTLHHCIESVLALRHPGVQFEIVIVDDGSQDTSQEIIKSFEDTERIITCYHKKNKGKGAALRTGFASSRGEILMIYDADLEYDAGELLKLLDPLLTDTADIVYGSRMSNANNPVGYWYMYLGNKLISTVAKLLYGKKITDVETCYKAFSRSFLNSIALTSDGFGFEAEFTAQVLKSSLRLTEIPISYKPRDYAHGKKISWRDGVEAVWILLRFKFKR